jgi:signal transduction histidine kinase
LALASLNCSRLSRSHSSHVLFIAIISSVAIILSLVIFQYSANISTRAIELSANDVRSNAEIEAHDISQILVHKVEGVMDNLEIIASAESVHLKELDRARSLFDSGQSSSSEMTDTYFWVDEEGKLVWADAFSRNASLYEQFRGGDRSQRSYFTEPRDTGQPHVSSVIESVDGVPRLYMAYPIMIPFQSPDGEQDLQFEGVIVAASNLDKFGEFLSSQVSAKFQHTIGLTDREGTVLFSEAPEIIGKDIFGPETHAVLPDEIEGAFYSIIRAALQGQTGSGDFTYQGNVSTIAYQPVKIGENDFGVLYIVAPHQIALGPSALINEQRTLTFISIVAIAAVSAGIAYIILAWNNQLKRTVAKRTDDLAKSNESLRVALEQLKIHDKMQTEFINVAAHELRTPVQPLLGVAEIMNQSVTAKATRTLEVSEEEIEILLRNAKRLERIINNVLDATKIEGRGFTLEKETFDMNEKVRNVIRDILDIENIETLDDGTIIANTPPVPRLDKKSVQIVFRPYPLRLLVHADETRIFQVVSNLLNNALKFTKEGSIEISLSMNGKDADNNPELILRIKDTGSGIHPDVLPRLFTKFATKSDAGTGLGLYISRNIVEQHGGRIWAENSADGKGATFYFALPAMESAREEKVHT